MAAIRPITTYKGKIIPLSNDSTDTDQIIPKVHLERISESGFSPFAFDEWRYLPNGSDNPDFNPNRPQYKGASILITGDNFGCGSNRGHAAQTFKDYGFRIITTGSLSDIFYMSCVRSAILPIVLERSAREHLTQYVEIEVDLPNQAALSPGECFHFGISGTWKGKLVSGLNDTAITL